MDTGFKNLLKDLKTRVLFSIILVIFILILDFSVHILPKLVIGKFKGYAFGYAETFQSLELEGKLRFSLWRIKHNFKNFFQYWFCLPHNVKIINFKDFITLDGNPWYENIFGHLILFSLFGFLYSLIGAGLFNVFLTGMIINIIHEYIVEGMYCDPSFVDLWLDTLGLLIGITLYIIFKKRWGIIADN